MVCTRLQRRGFLAVGINGALAMFLTSHAFGAEAEEQEKKQKYELPKLPKNCGNPKWEVPEAELQEKFIIIKGGVDADTGHVYFLLELKADANAEFLSYNVGFYDKDGVKIVTTSATCSIPNVSKKGDRVRLTFVGYPVGKNAYSDSLWAKATTVKIFK